MASVLLQGYRENDNYIECCTVVAGFDEVIVIPSEPTEEIYDRGDEAIPELRAIAARIVAEFPGNAAAQKQAHDINIAITQYAEEKRQEEEEEKQAAEEQRQRQIQQEAERLQRQLADDLKTAEIRTAAIKSLQPLVDATDCTGAVAYNEHTGVAEIKHDGDTCPIHEI